jgi:hypothetical protein
MIETVLLALFVAKIKGYKLDLLFKDWAIYPVIIFTFFYLGINIVSVKELLPRMELKVLLK